VRDVDKNIKREYELKKGELRCNNSIYFHVKRNDAIAKLSSEHIVDNEEILY
jgi:hypothetical protein